ncbi:MAG TPA: AMP-binding protein [Ktedonobacterales bacterium]|jgi:phenylacetate-coenzyme A ligase PaaK-like adenylate-forming protein
MLEAGLAQLRFAASILFGTRFSLWSLDQLIAALQATQREFGFLGAEGRELLGSPQLDEETRRAMQLRRFRSQAVRAAHETRYYQQLFERLGLDPGRIRYEEIARLPLTSKADLRRDPEAFVCRKAHPFLRVLTTGTTGWPTSVAFSTYELRVYAALTAISALFSGELTSEDIIQLSTSSRGMLGNACLVGAGAHLGALVYLAGVTEPAHALALLAEKHHLAGKKTRTSVLYTYPSYLGALIECGLALGYRPSDFGLERIFVGGEIVTEGLKVRSQQLFGDARVIEGGYGMTEIWPFGGQLCEQGHLHFEVSQGFLEVANLGTSAPALAGETGTLVATPFYPYRETTLLLRYGTGDVVQRLAEPLTCRLRHLPATSRLLGKVALSVQHGRGWTYPRQLAEALESLEEVPLPARYGYWAVPGGVAVEVVVREATQQVRRHIETGLEEQGVPLQALHLREDRSQLQHPMPLRGDLREHTFGPLTLDHPLSSERSVFPQAAEAMLKGAL